MPAERLYYADSALTQFTATVTDIRERSRSGGVSLWQIALDRSAFYPTSGGQPHDTGALTATAPSGARLEAPVTEVEEDEHGEIWHLTPKPLPAGTPVEGLIHLQRRRDHMQQHSGQHLLSALFYRELQAATVSFHLGETLSTIDLNVPSLDTAQFARIERLANAIVAESRPVTLRTVSAEQAESLLAAGALRKLPDRPGDIRLVVIAGNPAAGAIAGNPSAPDLDVLDLNACGGTHVASTSQIGAVLLRGVERLRQSLRVGFLCGDRAIAAARADDLLLAQLGRELSVGRADLPTALARIQTERKASAKERQLLLEDLANYHAARLIVEDPPQNDLRLVRRIFPDRDPDYVKLLASRVARAAPHTAALLASTRQSPAIVVLATSADLHRHAGDLLRDVLAATGSRGGGSPTLAQALIPTSQLDETLNALEAAMRS